jgi:hypothetical protein
MRDWGFGIRDLILRFRMSRCDAAIESFGMRALGMSDVALPR